jgi:hypothetical protein
MHGGANEKTYEAIGVAGCISLKKRVQTGVKVAVVKTADSQSPRYGAKYFTQCLSHRSKAGWNTRRTAIKGARIPATWCKRCEKMEAENAQGEQESVD